MAYTKYSLIPANNTAAPPDGAPEGMLPSAVNDTMRDMMAQIRDVGDGVRDGTYTMTAPKITGGTITGVTLTGNTLTNPVITGATLTTSAFNGTVGATTASTGAFTTLSTSSTTTLSGLTASTALALDASKNVVSVTNTGTGNNVLSASPTLTGTIAGASLSLSSLTSGRVTYAGASGLLSDSSNLTFNGTNLGLGTSSPSAKFNVVGGNAIFDNTTLEVGFNSTGSNRYTLLYATNTGSTLYYGVNGTASGAQIDITGISENASYFGSRSNTPLQFFTNNTARTVITSAGLVGIGTSSPGAALSVSTSTMTNQILIGQNASASTYGAISLNGVNTDAGRVGFTGGSGDTALYYDVPAGIHTFRITGSTKMILNASGNLGIGTTTPSDTLSVINSTMTNQIVMGLNTTDTTYGSISFSGSNSGANRIGLTGGGGSDKSLYLDSPTGGAFYFRINAVSRQEISSSGIVTMSAYGAGAATFAANGSISSVSDETWKIKDGIPVNTDVMLQKLEPGYWFYNAEKAPIFGADRQLGFYAQNVREAIGAEAAPTPEEGKPWGYYDRSVLSVVVMSLKNALNTIEELKQRIATLENK